jgi:signal transduction histidine kinase/CheY-like chemotaxis protein
MSHANIIIEAYCLLMTVILLVCNFLSSGFRTADRKSRIMSAMLASNAVIISSFTVTVWVDGNTSYVFLNNIATGICYALGALMTELFGEYIFCITDSDKPIRRFIPVVLKIACTAAIILDVISIFNGMYFSTLNGYHVRGPFYIFNQVLILGLMLLELIYILAWRKDIGKNAAALAMYCLLPIASILLQIFVQEYVLIYPAVTLSLFIIYVVSYINQASLLNQKNEELTKAIGDLKLAKKEAEEANRAKSDFLSSMSHDIRTPLNAIIGMTDMAVDNIDNKKHALENLGIVQASSRHLLSLVNDVLDLSRIESGRVTIAQTEFILPDLLTDIQKIAWPLSHAKSQSFSVTANSVEHEFYIGDMPRLKQILVNFISNAVKYTPSGGSIQLTVEEVPSGVPENATLKFTCSDNGIGIEPEKQKEIFDPFVRGVKSTLNPVEGSGLGLAIVRDIVDAMHGTLGLTSESGKGSVFTASIPLKLADDEKMLLQFKDVKDYRVLFITDDRTMCRTVEENYRARIGSFCSVLSSDVILEGEPEDNGCYDAILVSSEKQPSEVIKKLREKYPQQDIIYTSSMRMLDNEEQILNAGADAVLCRPVFRVSLFEEYQTLRLKKETPAGTDRYLTGRNILVAEDQSINYMVAEYMLKNAGASVERAENGRKAVDRFLASKPGYYDLILMDIMMPVMNGYAATAAIRASDRPDSQTVAIAAMTANAFSEDIQKSFACGMNAHISKPIEPDVLKESLIQLFRTMETMK